MATGTEILNYRGDADLGFGPDGVPYSNGGTAAAFGQLGGILANLNQQNQVWNAMKYQQAVKDRDAVAETFASANIDSPLLEEDLSVVQKKYDEVKEFLLQNPNPSKDRTKYTEFKSKISELNRLKTYGKTRYALASAQRIDISNTRDKELRESKEAHLKGQLSKGINHVVDPYQKDVDWDFPVPTTTTVIKTEDLTKDGLPYQSVTTSNMKALQEQFAQTKMIEGLDKPFPNQVSKFYEFSAANDMLLQPENLLAINAKINSINTRYGYTQDSPNYIHPIAKMEDGEWKVADAFNFTRGVQMSENLREETSTSLNEAKIEGRLKTAKTASEYVGQKKTAAETIEIGAKTAKTIAETKGVETDTEKKERELREMKAESVEVVSTAYDLFRVKSASGGFNKMGDAEIKIAANAGIAQGAEWKEIGASDAAVREILSTPLYNDYTGSFKGLLKPTRVLYFKDPGGDPSKDKLVSLDEKGNVLKSVFRSQAWQEIILARNNYGTGEGAKKIVNEAITSGRLAAEDIEGSGEYSTPITPADTTPPSEADPLAPEAKFSEMQGSDGKTYYKSQKGDELYDADRNLQWILINGEWVKPKK